jgi:hypothetical protein
MNVIGLGGIGAISDIQLTKIKRDSNGNPRYVVHFLSIANSYPKAVKLANKIGGRKYHTKGYGGGIVFQSFNTKDLKKAILKISQTR